MESERTRYREFTSWSGVVQSILWGVVLLSCWPILAGWDGDVAPAMRWPVVGGVLGLTGLIVWLLGGLTVLVQERRIFMHLGRVPG